MDSFEEVDFSDIISIIALGAVEEAKASKKPKTTGLPGAEYVRELLQCGNEKRIDEVIRMQKETFEELCLLRNKIMVSRTHDISWSISRS
jgi:hypothetical protein